MEELLIGGDLKSMVDALEVYGSVSGIPVYHFGPRSQAGDYIAWAEDGPADDEWADDRMEQQGLSGTVDFFTKLKIDPRMREIQNIINDSGVSWRLGSIQRERDTGYTHYEWRWEAELWRA